MSEPLIVTSFETLRVLVIDDDRGILEVVEAILKTAGFAGVVKAVSAVGALNILADKHKRFNCIVCDYGMDVMNGLMLLKEIRSGKHAHIPRDQCFIMLTAYGQEAVVRAALELDVNGYVRKPVTKDSLTKAIHRAFNRMPALKAPEAYAAVDVPSQA
ncbi:MAG: response regulator [Rhodospirillaceae bacterium]|nr:response regulator [Rhodospirillaceae bacterium]